VNHGPRQWLSEQLAPSYGQRGGRSLHPHSRAPPSPPHTRQEPDHKGHGSISYPAATSPTGVKPRRSVTLAHRRRRAPPASRSLLPCDLLPQRVPRSLPTGWLGNHHPTPLGLPRRPALDAPAPGDSPPACQHGPDVLCCWWQLDRRLTLRRSVIPGRAKDVPADSRVGRRQAATTETVPTCRWS
jgi:hypothetical protein